MVYKNHQKTKENQSRHADPLRTLENLSKTIKNHQKRLPIRLRHTASEIAARATAAPEPGSEAGFMDVKLFGKKTYFF